MDSYNRDLLLNDDNRKDAKALWDAITIEYSSTKARNCSRAFNKFLNIKCNDGDLKKYLAQFRQSSNELKDIGVKLDDDLLAHMALHHLPEEF